VDKNILPIGAVFHIGTALFLKTPWKWFPTKTSVRRSDYIHPVEGGTRYIKPVCGMAKLLA
jgi:hypothetical protein